MNDRPAADPAQALEQRELISITNRLSVNGRNHVTWKETGALRRTSRREPLHVNPAIDVRSRRRVVEKSEAEPARAGGGGSVREQCDDEQRGTHFSDSLARNDSKSTMVSVPGDNVRSTHFDSARGSGQRR